MPSTVAALHVVFLFLSAAATATLGGYAWRRRSEPGSLPFAALMAATSFWSATYAAGLLTLHPRWRLFWQGVQWLSIATIPVWFLLFALEYTGNDELATRRITAGLLAVPALTLGLVWTNRFHGLVWTENRVVVVDGLAFMIESYGPWFWLFFAYGYGLILLATGLLVRLIVRSDYLFTDQSVLLLVGAAVPVLGNSASVFLPTRPIPGIDLAPYALVVTGLAFGYALFRRRLFDLVPATRRLGRSAAIRELEDGVLIVDTDHQIIYCNPAAGELLDCEPSDVLGAPARSLVDESALDFDTEDALAELERDDRVYEVRTSPITDRGDQRIGHTLVVSDVTGRARREARLQRQRDELARLEELNAVVRGVNRALVSASDRAEIERAVCDRLTAVDRYRAACVADGPTWEGNADRWTVVGDGGTTALHSAELPDDEGEPTVVADTEGTWTVVPLAYGRTVYGAFGVLAADGEISDREREVLAELGELIGQAINAVENRRLLSAEAVVELEFRSDDTAGTLLGAAAAADCRFELAGLVPDAGAGHLAYLRVEDGSLDEAVTALATVDGAEARVVREADGALVEWVAPSGTLLGLVAEHGGNVLEATADGKTTRVVVEVASDADVRALTERVSDAVAGTRLAAKRERARPADRAAGVGDTVPELTERQREALEVAYRAGYFDWPRESTAEEIADSLDIAAPTLHAHLRKAEGTLLAELFEDAPDG